MDWRSNLLQTSRTLPVRSSAILGSPGDDYPQLPTCPNLDTLGSSAHDGQEGRALGNPGTKLPLIGFCKKTIKIFLIGPFKFARQLAGFPGNVEVRETRPADS